MSKMFKRSMIGFICLIVIMAMNAPVIFAQPASDIAGHWAQKTIEKWEARHWVSGYPDGTFRPDHPISRAELISMVNKSFQFSKQANSGFSDVIKSSWYYDDVRVAKAQGYVAGYPDGTFKPNKMITREQLAVIIDKLLNLGTTDTASRFSDAGKIESYAKGAVGAVHDYGLMVGYPDGTFHPGQTATRAEAVATLDRVLNQKSGTVTYSAAGTYGSSNTQLQLAGNADITVPGVTLQNMTITGNLVLDKGIGEGDVHLNHVTVKGTTTVLGGGIHSVHIENSSFGKIIVQKVNGAVRIVFQGNDSVGSMDVRSGVKVEKADSNAAVSISDLLLQQHIDKSEPIELSGDIGNLKIDASNLNLTIDAGSVKSLQVAKGISGIKLAVSAQSSIQDVNLDGSAAITGKGTIGKLEVNANGSSSEIKPKGLTIKDGFTMSIQGNVEDSSDSTGTAPAGGFGGGGAPSDGSGNGGSPSSAPSNQDVVFASSQSAAAGSSVTLDAAPAQGVTAWFAPADTTAFAEGSTMTKMVGDGSTQTIKAPATTGTYKLFLQNSVGVSPASSATLTVTPAVSPDDVFSADQTVAPGATVTLNAAPQQGYTAWFAPAGTTSFTADGARMTSLTGDGSKTQISAPAAVDTYYLYLVDGNGMATPASKAKLKVDDSTPTDQDTYFQADKLVSKGTVTLAAAPPVGETVCFAPAGTTVFTAGPTLTKLTGDGSTTALAIPATDGTYKLYVIGNNGNSSQPSSATLTVDATAPAAQDQVLSANQTVKGGATVTLNQAPALNITAWLAPEGTTASQFAEGATMTKFAGDGSTVKMTAPASPESYKLYLVDQAGNVSKSSKASLIVDNTAPTYQDAVLPADQNVISGAKITLAQVAKTGDTIWLAPPGTTSFMPSKQMTSASGTATQIAAPQVEGGYRLYVVDAAGNVSNPSTYLVTVNDTNQNQILSASVTVTAGNTLTLDKAPPIGETVWLAPPFATIFQEDPSTMTRLVGDGSTKTITVPKTKAQYKLFVVDQAGNVSLPSNATVTVN